MLVRADAVLIGPGLGREPGSPEAAVQAMSLALEMGVPVVVDADGITALAAELDSLGPGGTPVLITPHTMEARSLLGGQPTHERVHAYAAQIARYCLKGVPTWFQTACAGKPTRAATHAWQWVAAAIA